MSDSWNILFYTKYIGDLITCPLLLLEHSYFGPKKINRALKSLFVDAAKRIGRHIRKGLHDAAGKSLLTHLCRPVRSTFAVRETASLGQQMLNAPVGINGLKGSCPLHHAGLS